MHEHVGEEADHRHREDRRNDRAEDLVEFVSVHDPALVSKCVPGPKGLTRLELRQSRGRPAGPCNPQRWFARACRPVLRRPAAGGLLTRVGRGPDTPAPRQLGPAQGKPRMPQRKPPTRDRLPGRSGCLFAPRLQGGPARTFEPLPCPSFEDAFEAVRRGRADPRDDPDREFAGRSCGGNPPPDPGSGPAHRGRTFPAREPPPARPARRHARDDPHGAEPRPGARPVPRDR